MNIDITYNGGDLSGHFGDGFSQFIREKAEAMALEHYKSTVATRLLTAPGGSVRNWQVTMTRVVSSNLESVGYDGQGQKLHIKFKGGPAVYVYSRVPAQVYQELMGAFSKGHYFHSHVKNRYSFVRQ